jgi:hypothetical protein
LELDRHAQTLAQDGDKDAGPAACESCSVALPRWYRAIPQPLRWACGGAVALACVGAVYGLTESVRDYPASSWFGVTLYVTMLGALVGFLLGLFTGTVSLVAGRAARRL